MSWTVHVVNGAAILGFLVAGLLAHPTTRRASLVVLGIAAAACLVAGLVSARFVFRRRPYLPTLPAVVSDALAGRRATRRGRRRQTT
jgi:hypothetical protein